jgi:hypothetical protein
MTSVVLIFSASALKLKMIRCLRTWREAALISSIVVAIRLSIGALEWPPQIGY